MGEDGYRIDVGVFDQSLQHRLKRVARIDGAVAIIDVIDHSAAGRPGEQDRRDVDARVMNNLREAIDRFLEAGVEAMDEDENPVPGRALDPRIEVRFRLSQVHAIGAQDDEVTLRIARQRGRERHIPRLACACGWNRYDDIGEIESSPSGPAEHDARRLNDGRTCRRHKEVDLAGVRRSRSDDKRAVRAARAACGDRRQRDHTNRCPIPRPCSPQRRTQPTPQTPPQPHDASLRLVELWDGLSG